jgi:hypothetical protein
LSTVGSSSPPQRRGTYWVLALSGLLVAAVFGYLAVEYVTTDLCVDAARGETCIDKSSSARTAGLIVAALTALLALATTAAAVRLARGRGSYRGLQWLATLTAILALVSILL